MSIKALPTVESSISSIILSHWYNCFIVIICTLDHSK
jgi:hypothetical protein